MLKPFYHNFKVRTLPRSPKKKTTSCWFLLSVESSTVYNRQARRQRGNVLPCQQCTSSTSTGTELIHARVHYLEWKTWWLCTFQLECVHNSSRKQVLEIFHMTIQGLIKTTADRTKGYSPCSNARNNRTPGHASRNWRWFWQPKSPAF